MIGSLIKSLVYDPATKQLTARFSTSTYIYHGVPEQLGNSINNTFQSREQEDVFACHVEGKYRSTRETT